MIYNESTSAKNDNNTWLYLLFQVDYYLLAWCNCGEGKENFKIQQEKSFTINGQTLKPNFSKLCMEETSSKISSYSYYPHEIRKEKQNSLQNKCEGNLQGWAKKQPASIIKKKEKGNKTASLCPPHKRSVVVL